MRLISLLFCLSLTNSFLANGFEFYENKNSSPLTDCSFSYQVDSPNSTVTVSELSGVHVKVKLLNSDWNPVFSCTDNCPDPIVINDIENGLYNLNVIYFDEEWQLVCASLVPLEISGSGCTDDDADGYCSDVDCDDNDPNIVPQSAGTPCDDNDSSTIDDEIQDDGCTCAGTATTPNCTVVLLTDPAGGVSISGIIASVPKVRIFDATTWETVYQCTGNCPNDIYLSGLGEGYYNLDVTLLDANLEVFCTHNEYFTLDSGSCQDNDNDGICADVDCDDNNPTLPGTVGASCDDLNSATINDVITTDGCTCEGEVFEGPCNISYTTGYNDVTISGLVGEHVKVRLYDSNWQVFFSCFDDCAGEEIVSGLEHGQAYILKVELFDDNWERLCSMEETFIAESGNSCVDNDNDGYCADVDCDDESAEWPKLPGTPCNDNNVETDNDVIQYDGCSCAGEILDPCGGVTIEWGTDYIEVGHLPEGLTTELKIYKNWVLMYECLGDCEDPTIISGLGAGDFIVRVKVFDDEWTLLCQTQTEISLLLDVPGNLAAGGGGSGAADVSSRGEYSQEKGLMVSGIYPNPVREQLFIELTQAKLTSLDVMVYNQLGQLIKRKIFEADGETSVTLDVSDMQTGVYYLVARADGSLVWSGDFVKH